jgi:putative glutamine amidotransferase
MKPLIGITSEFQPGSLAGRSWNESSLLVSYAEAVERAGGLPVILPIAKPETGRELAARLDGIILSGGNCDVPPASYGATPHGTTKPLPLDRWNSECLWLDVASVEDKPVLGICLGMQVIGVKAGTKLIQDIQDEAPSASQHSDSTRMFQHAVTLEPGSWLETIAPSRKLAITSSHHQALKAVPAGFKLAAKSEDGIIEAIESQNGQFLVGVQWHPERSLNQPDWLLKAFVDRCARST